MEGETNKTCMVKQAFHTKEIVCIYIRTIPLLYKLFK